MLDLFSGIGGMSLAAEWAGIETVAFCEIEPYCQKVLKKHWPTVPIYTDVRELTRERLEKDGVIGNGRTIDLICGGYPCQPFSVAGQRRGAEDDRHLWPEMFRLVRELRPTWVVGENVAGHVSLGLDDVLSDLESAGYQTRAFVIPAAAVGAPHRRDRVFIVARSSEMVLNTSGERWEKGDDETENFGEGETEWESWTADSFNGLIWESEPDVGRVANGVPNRVDRLRALGNAVVPQQVYPFFLAIKHVNSLRIP